ncbi:Probable purine permease 11, variant 2 [Ancistrocladus abbreviatus]
MDISNHGGESSTLVEPLISALAAKLVISTKDEKSTEPSMLPKLNRTQWWLLVALNIFFVIGGQTAAVLLAKFYHDQGGSSTFMATIVQTAGFPVLFIPLLIMPSSSWSSIASNPLSWKQTILIYVALGILTAIDNLLYSLGLFYLSASTYSLICATQLAFSALFSFFINSQKLTPLILNSVAMLSLSSALLAVNESSDAPQGVTKLHYAIGFLCSLGGSAFYALLLSLIQLSFHKALRRENFSVVIEMQIYRSIVATLVTTAGLFAGGQWRKLEAEIKNFHAGEASYAMTLVWTAVSWQLCSIGVVGLIFLISSLFSNVISTLALVVAPIASVMVFHDNMNSIKIITMLQALWGFASYIYQNYLDNSSLRRS